MNGSNLVLLLIIILGVWGRSGVVTGAAGILLILNMLRVPRAVSLLAAHALDVGLMFLMLSILVPFATGEVQLRDLWRGLVSVPGLLTLGAAVLATRLNSGGLRLLQDDPSLITAIVVGSMVGVVFARGLPVGPLMAAGLAWVLVSLWRLIP